MHITSNHFPLLRLLLKRFGIRTNIALILGAVFGSTQYLHAVGIPNAANET